MWHKYNPWGDNVFCTISRSIGQNSRSYGLFKFLWLGYPSIGWLQLQWIVGKFRALFINVWHPYHSPKANGSPCIALTAGNLWCQCCAWRLWDSLAGRPPALHADIDCWLGQTPSSTLTRSHHSAWPQPNPHHTKGVLQTSKLKLTFFCTKSSISSKMEKYRLFCDAKNYIFPFSIILPTLFMPADGLELPGVRSSADTVMIQIVSHLCTERVLKRLKKSQ